VNINKILIGSATFLILLYIISFAVEDANAQGMAEVYIIKDVMASKTKKVSDFTWMDGKKEIVFSEFTKGKTVFINFWGTWCGPCRREIPDIIKIGKELNPDDFVIIGIALEHSAPSKALGKVQKYATAKGINYINIVDDNKKLSTAFGGIRAVPSTFIVDKKGNIAEKIVGGRSYSAFMKSLKKVL
jgi:thiol-disulfide isomerase/thioredoxin